MTATTDPASLTERLARCYTGVVHDVMRDMGLRDFTLPPEIRPIQPDRPFAGPVFTVRGRRVQGTDAHETLLAWTGFLSKVPAGYVVVCQPNDDEVAHMGELSAETLKARGVLGYVVDGGCRDVDFILKLGFPVCCRYFTPKDIVGIWMPEVYDELVVIGPVVVNPGDFLLGDRDGTVVIPRAAAADVIDRAEAAINTENLVRKAILSGTDPQQAYLQYGKF